MSDKPVEYRFPQPDFTVEYRFPDLKLPGPSSFLWAYADILVLVLLNFRVKRLAVLQSKCHHKIFRCYASSVVKKILYRDMINRKKNISRNNAKLFPDTAFFHI